MIVWIRSWIVLLGCIVCFPLMADVTPAMLTHTVKQYVLTHINLPVKNLTVDVLSLSDNLNLPDCPQIEVHFENPQQQFQLGEQTLVASCANPHWRLYLQTNIYGLVPVVVASRAILQNESLNDNDLQLKDMPSNQIVEPYFTSLDGFVSSRARNYIPAMAIIRPEMLKRQYLVKVGSHVNIVLESGSLYVKMSGIALDNGMQGDIIRARNTSSGRIVDAKVVDSMTVKVD